MTILITAFIVVLILAIAIWAIERAPIQQPFKWIIEAIACVIAILVIANRAGLGLS